MLKKKRREILNHCEPAASLKGVGPAQDHVINFTLFLLPFQTVGTMVPGRALELAVVAPQQPDTQHNIRSHFVFLDLSQKVISSGMGQVGR